MNKKDITARIDYRKKLILWTEHEIENAIVKIKYEITVTENGKLKVTKLGANYG